MKNTVLLLSTFVFLGTAACAGELTQDEQNTLWEAHQGTGGGSGTSTTTSSTTSAGTGGSGPAVDMCIVSTTTTGPMHTCQTAACHGGPTVSAGLNLDNVNLTMNAKAKYLDVPNTGDPTGQAPPCAGGMFKLIDSAAPMNSLLYTKAEAPGDMTHPCGGKMPVIGTFTADDKACLLKWINSVIALK
jgi:hypothetical protein